MENEIFRHLPFPFVGDRFPPNLGAVIQRTVLQGLEPARIVAHTGDNSWLVGDGVNDPNATDAVEVGHMSHVVERNSSVATLASLPLGMQAVRDNPGDPRQIEPFVRGDD